jgi:hypothetical protein
VQGNCWVLLGHCGVTGLLLSEEAEACFVLTLREAVAHFAGRNTKFMDTEMGTVASADKTPVNGTL